MKEGDVRMIFGNPMDIKCPLGQAKLIKKLGDYGKVFENWLVEYLDDPNHHYNALIKKTDGESTTK
jgi:hypothetical protein